MYVASKSVVIADCVHYRAVCVIVKMLLFTMGVPDSDFSNPAEAALILANLGRAVARFDTLSIWLTTNRFHSRTLIIAESDAATQLTTPHA